MSVLLVLLLPGFLLINALFVAAEFALVRAQGELLPDEGRRAQLARQQIEHMDDYLSVCQIAITMASIGIGFVGERLLALWLELPLQGVVSAGLAATIALVLAYATTTVVHIIVAEQAPKIWALGSAERALLLLGAPLEVAARLLRPLVSLLSRSASALARLGGEPQRVEPGAEAVRALVARAVLGGRLDPGEAHMLEGVFDLHERQAQQVMTPWSRVLSVQSETSAQEALRQALDDGHSRLPVCRGEEIVGVVGLATLAGDLVAGQGRAVAELCVPVMLVPEARPLDDLLQDMQANRATLVCVVDEYGRACGVVTIEDIVEEVVGEIRDERDHEEDGVWVLAEGVLGVRGDLPLVELCEQGVLLPEDAHTVGGLVMHHLGRAAQVGDRVECGDYCLEVLAVSGPRIGEVRISPAA